MWQMHPGLGVYEYCLYRHFWYISFPGAELSYPLTLRTKLRVTKVRFTTAMETRQVPPSPLIFLFWFVSYDYCITSEIIFWRKTVSLHCVTYVSKLVQHNYRIQV